MADGRDIVDALRAARQAETYVRQTRRPVFLHLRTVRLMGHAGSDVESGYRDAGEIERDAFDDPLLHSARRLIEECGVGAGDILSLYDAIGAQVRRAMERACERPKLNSAQDVTAPIAARSLSTRKIAAALKSKALWTSGLKANHNICRG